MELLSRYELARVLGFKKNTLSNWLGHYSFDKFYVGHKVNLNKEFIDTLLDYLLKKGYYKDIKRLEKMFEGKIWTT